MAIILSYLGFIFNFRNHLSYFADKPHFTGQKRDHELSTLIAKWFTHLGLEVSVPKYNVLLSFPNFENSSSNWGQWDESNNNKVSNETRLQFSLVLLKCCIYLQYIFYTGSHCHWRRGKDMARQIFC